MKYKRYKNKRQIQEQTKRNIAKYTIIIIIIIIIPGKKENL
jgi:hypothetical protein